MPRRSWAAVLLVLAVGCGGPPATPADPPPQPTGVPAAGREARHLALPFDTYDLSTADMQTVETAVDVLVGRCLRRQGIAWQSLSLPRGEADPTHRRRYGVMEPLIAERFGYHLPPDTPEAAKRQRQHKARARLPMDVQIAAFGKTGTGGCWKKAHTSLLRQGPGPDIDRLYAHHTKTLAASRQQAPVTRAVRAWKTCMLAKGYRYEDPYEAGADKRWWNSRRPSQRELATAVADVACKEETRLAIIWAGAETRLQREIIRTHGAEFERAATAKRRRLAFARGVLTREQDDPGPVATSPR
ncbi:hypothetical protein [Streptomyces sp. NPDC003006]